MFRTIIIPEEIEQCQRDLQSTLHKKLTQHGEYNIGFPGGSWVESINLNHQIWYFTFEIGPEEKSPRYWNGFGLSNELSDKRSNNIVVEINIPTTGVNRRVSGFFAKDDDGSTYLFHRGGLGGGRKGVGKEAFLNRSSYSLTEVMTEERSESAILVGKVNDDNFVDDLEHFLIDISRFKLFATSGQDDEASYLSMTELLDKIQNERPKLKVPSKSESTVENYERSPFVKEFALRRAKGSCQLCLEIAPFNNRYGQPYLEVHHVKWLSNEGSDTPDNVVALCPNCHRKMHIVDSQKDVDFLLEKAASI